MNFPNNRRQFHFTKNAGNVQKYMMHSPQKLLCQSSRAMFSEILANISNNLRVLMRDL